MITTAGRCVTLSLMTLFFGNVDSWVHAQDRAKEENPVVGVRTFTITVKFIQRRYLVYIPKSYDRSKKWPVVVMFHGGGGTAHNAMWETSWDEKGNKEGFLAVFPEGTPPDASRSGNFRDNAQSWNDGSQRGTIGAVTRQVPDIEFILAMLSDLKTHFSVDELRIYATGFSNGASMTFRVARELSLTFAAVAPFAGVDWMTDTASHCAVPLLYMTGTADPLNPQGGGPIHIGKKYFGTKPATQAMIDTWVKMHGCPDKGRVVYDKDGARGIAYGFPGKPPDVVLYTIEKHGHHWPGGKSLLPVRLAGENTATLKATDIIWDFFKAHAISDDKDAHKTLQRTRTSRADELGR
jgi:polyhydroxybutyrate depolymerase